MVNKFIFPDSNFLASTGTKTHENGFRKKYGFIFPVNMIEIGDKKWLKKKDPETV
jgi:hypothetical protein